MQDFVPLTIADAQRDTPDAIVLTLAIPEQLKPVFKFRPGQHVNVRTIHAGAELRRSYSICSVPAAPDLRIAIKRVQGGAFSVWANANLFTGMTLDVSPPTGRFALAAGDGAARHIVGIAAGSGITPIASIVGHALTTEPLTDVTLIYGNRTIESTIFRQHLEDLKDRFIGRFSLVHVLSKGEMGNASVLEGRINGEKVSALLASQMSGRKEATQIYLCGPGSLIKETRAALFAMGFSRDRVHHEFFAAGGGAYRLPPIATQPGSLESPSVESAIVEIIATLDGSRHRFTARPGETVIDAALRAGVKAPYACKGGMCCSCRARLIEGVAPMKLNYSLEAWEIEKGFVLTCQAVPKSARLVLDFDQM